MRINKKLIYRSNAPLHKKIITIGIFIFCLWALIFSYFLHKETQSYKRISHKALVKYSKKQTPKVKGNTSKQYRLTPPDRTHTILVVTDAQGSEWLNNNGYTWADQPNTTSLTELYLETNSELPGMNTNGASRYVYFWGTEQQAATIGNVRIDGKVVFFKADNGYLNSLSQK